MGMSNSPGVGERDQSACDQLRRAVGLPFTAASAISIAREIIGDRPHWRRRVLAREIERIHCARGGAPASNYEGLLKCTKTCLSVMKKNGEAINVIKSAGIWCSSDHAPGNASAITDERISKTRADEIVTEKRIGCGDEAVYVYYFPVYKEMALLKGYLSWPCKIGRTALIATDRVSCQGGTALSEFPVIGLEIKTKNSTHLERVIHGELKSLWKQIKTSPGFEWFTTSPDLIEKWHVAFLSASGFLKE